MSSTDNELRALFAKSIAPLRSTVAGSVDVGIDRAADSYLMPVLGRENIVAAQPIDRALDALWSDSPAPLRALARVLGRLAQSLKTTEAQRSDVSSLMYPMY